MTEFLRDLRGTRPSMVRLEDHLRRVNRERRGKDALIVGLGLSVLLNWALAVYIYTCLSH